MRELTKILNEWNWPLNIVQIHRTNQCYKFEVPQTVCTMWDLRFSQQNCWWFKSNRMLHWDYLWADMAYHPRVLETSVCFCICCDKKWKPTTNYVVHHQSTNGVQFVILCTWNKENLVLFVFGYTAKPLSIVPICVAFPQLSFSTSSPKKSSINTVYLYWMHCSSKCWFHAWTVGPNPQLSLNDHF